MLLKLVILVLLVGSGFVLVRWTPVGSYLTQERITALFTTLSTLWWAPLLLTVLYVLAATLVLPVSPLVIGGGLVFGIALGTFYNVLGLYLGTVISFFVAKWLGRDFVQHIAGQRLRKVERAFEKRGFWPLVQIRFFPVPFAVINYGAALAGVRPAQFFLASGLGLIPSTFVHTYFPARLFYAANAEERYPLVAAYILVLTVLAMLTGYPTIRHRLRRRRRYREILHQRRQRDE